MSEQPDQDRDQHDPENILWKDKPQGFLFEEMAEDWRDHWQDMPEFTHENLQPVKSLIMHFATMEDYYEFAKLIDQNCYEKTKSRWYPEADVAENTSWRYISES